jgi:prophage regulatory protein
MPKEKMRLEKLPSTGLLRVDQVLQFVPISRSCWWSGVKSGKFPQPVRLSQRVTAWRAADIQEVVAGRPAADVCAGAPGLKDAPCR